MQVEYILFGAAWALLVAGYVWVVVRSVREIRKNRSLSDGWRTAWLFIVVLWIPFGPLAWILYDGWAHGDRSAPHVATGSRRAR